MNLSKIQNNDENYFVLEQFVGRNQRFKQLQIKPKVMISGKALTLLGFSVRNIQNYIESKVFEFFSNQEYADIITIDFLLLWERQKLTFEIKPNEAINKIDKAEIESKFLQSDLIYQIFLELDTKHKLDSKEKIALFIIAVSSYLKNPNDHCSAALKGDSSAGKDNLIKTILSCIPEEDSFFLTRGTSSAIEDEAEKVKIIAFSEINKHRENGANSDLTELFKQFAEGGVNILKKDASTGFKTTKNIKSEQKTLFYGTTETQSDDELETRYVIIPIRNDKIKNQIVVDDTLNKVSDEKFILKSSENKENWIRTGLKLLDKDFDIVIPFAKIFQNKILDPEDNKEKYLFDYTKERIKRDAKRLMSLTKAITLLYQKQRKIKIFNNKIKILYSEPCDFILAIKIFSEFFNLTYSGLDYRLQKTIDSIKENQGKHTNDILKLGFEIQYSDWVLRHKIQQELGIESVNTIKDRIEKLKDFGKVEVYWNPSIPKGYLIKPINQAINRVSLPISLIGIDRVLTGYLMGKTPYENKNIMLIDFSFIDNNQINLHKEGSVSCEEIDTLKIDTLNLSECKNLVYDIIKNADLGNGVNFSSILEKSKLPEYEIQESIENLSKKGHIFSITKGHWKVLE